MNKKYQKLVEETLLITTIVLAAGSVAFAWTGTGAGALILAFFAGGAVWISSAITKAKKTGNELRVLWLTTFFPFILFVLLYAVLLAPRVETPILFVAAGATMVWRLILLDMWRRQPLMRK